MQDVDNLYEFYGFYEFKAKISGNNLLLRNEGPNTIKFPDGQTVTYQYPTNKLGGMLWGDRVLNIEGSMTFEDSKNKIKAVVIFQDKKYHEFKGKIYIFEPDLYLQKKEASKLSDIKDCQTEICSIQGSWLESLFIGNE